ncbi:MAG: ABC transporter ATP-binding protein [Actinobacteria bacterium]|nr:MAG: ABC transporter ATP-binding protein [Actinomycetota bacterium]RIK06391.1 MAG: ABC transporter ATP-binding protein [Acidobacteriota bacterium]
MVEVQDVVKEYERGGQPLLALDGVSLSIESGTFVSITGPSGAGKSSLLHLLGGLDRATRGSVRVDHAELQELSDDALTAFRRQRLGFVFQFFNLLPTLSAWQNVALPRLLDGVPLRRTRARAVELLEQMGLADRVAHRPAELSGGELQRVAIARAMVADPVLILADEPTGNLDSVTGHGVLSRLKGCAADGRTVVMVTHDASAAAFGDRTVELRDGRILADRT